MTFANELAAIFHRDLTRMIQELQAFPDDATLWTTLPGVSNSAGTLALHLEGNLREYIGRQLGGVDYQRHRDAEFTGRDVSRAELIQRFEDVHEKIVKIVSVLTPAQLEATYPEKVYGAPLSTQQFVMAVIGHLNFHLGQIDYLRRIATNGTAIKFASL